MPFRIIIYTILLLLMEYATGWILRKTTGIAPEPGYRGKRWAIDGLVRLDCPAWAVACPSSSGFTWPCASCREERLAAQNQSSPTIK